MKHTKGPWIEDKQLDQTRWIIGGDTILASITDCKKEDAALFALAPTAPHSCDDPTCPGDQNRRKLEAAEEMAKALEEVNLDNTGVLTWAAIRQVQTALSAWEKAGKGEL